LKSEQAKSSTASDEPGLNIFPIQYENTPAPDSFLVSSVYYHIGLCHSTTGLLPSTVSE
jgi:hypothetical protein